MLMIGTIDPIKIDPKSELYAAMKFTIVFKIGLIALNCKC